MHWDMEGVSGIFTREHLWYWEEGVREYIAAEGRRLLTEEVNSAVTAAIDAGVDEIIVCDTHHGGENIELDKVIVDPRIIYLPRSVGMQGKQRRWMPFMDSSVDGMMILGHHAKAGTEGAFLPHTQMLAWADFSINGKSVGEMGIEACYTGHWNVPPILVHGTEEACQEAKDLFPGVVTAAVKSGVSHDVCAGLDPVAGRQLTAEKVFETIELLRTGSPKPYQPELPMKVRIRMQNREFADSAAAKPGVMRIDEVTVEKLVFQQCDVVKWIVGQGLNMPPRKT
jgi:D-amino peptidase